MISFIIVNYKQIDLTVELVKSIKNLCIYPKYEVIVVDNEAEYGNISKLNKVLNELVYVPLSWNSGFAKANNIGANIAQGELLFFINNDTLITSGTLTKLEKTLLNSEKAGIVCPLIKYYDEPEKIQYAGFTKINAFTGRNKTINSLSSIKEYKTEYAHGAAMLMKKSTFDLVGGFDESYFLYYEELDLSAKVKAKGFNIYVNSSTVIYHKVSSSTGVDSPLKNYYLTRNRILFMRKNSSAVNFYGYLLFHFMVSMPVNILKYILKGKINNLKKYLQGSMDGLTNKIGYKDLK